MCVNKLHRHSFCVICLSTAVGHDACGVLRSVDAHRSGLTSVHQTITVEQQQPHLREGHSSLCELHFNYLITSSGCCSEDYRDQCILGNRPGWEPRSKTAADVCLVWTLLRVCVCVTVRCLTFVRNWLTVFAHFLCIPVHLSVWNIFLRMCSCSQHEWLTPWSSSPRFRCERLYHSSISIIHSSFSTTKKKCLNLFKKLRLLLLMQMFLSLVFVTLLIQL